MKRPDKFELNVHKGSTAVILKLRGSAGMSEADTLRAKLEELA